MFGGWGVGEVGGWGSSRRNGMEDWAPGRVTEIAAAFCAKAIASAQSRPSASATANAPLNVSPAATQSTAFTRRDGKMRSQSPQ